MHSLSQDDRLKIYAVYLAIFNLPFNIQRKSTLLTALMGGADWSWRVVGITVGALEVLASNNYKRSKGICRAHLIDRIVTARAVFEIPHPLTEDQFFTKIWENDETVIATSSENNKPGGTLPKTTPIDYKLGMFICNSLIGFRHNKKEADFLHKLHVNYKNEAEEKVGAAATK